jgi:two-component system sensor histidine kinase KdpD
MKATNPSPTMSAPNHPAANSAEVECLLVAVGDSPSSEQLIRWTQNTAQKLGMHWKAVHVESGRPKGKTVQAAVGKNLSLARELGAEVVVTQDENIAAGLARMALNNRARQIIVGQTRQRRWQKWWPRQTLSDRLLNLSPMVEVHVVPLERPTGTFAKSRFDGSAPSGVGEYAVVVGVIAVMTVIGMLLPKSYYVQVGLVYLLAINVMSLRLGRGPILTAGVLIALIWDYFFASPNFQFGIDNFQDLILFIIYFVVALIAGQLTARIRAQARAERMREERATALFQFTRGLAEAKSLAEAITAAVRQIDGLLAATTTFALADEDQPTLSAGFQGSFIPDAREKAAALSAVHDRRITGRFTLTDADCAGYYVPLVRDDHAFGVLGVKLPAADTLTLGQRDLLDAFAQQLALVIERTQLRAAGEREKLLAESEKLHRALLESVSHELRTPLSVITATSEELCEAHLPEYADQVAEIHEAGQRLSHLVANLLDQTRLESGALRPRMDWCDPQDLANAAVANAQDSLAGRAVEIAVPENMPFVRADFALTEQVLVNLLLNAAVHTPPGTPVHIAAGVEPGGQRVFFAVADQGPGFAPSARKELFNKFARGSSAPPGGLGLGLSIVRGFVTAQGGEVILGDNPGGGAKITLYLPHTTPDNPPPE